MGQSLKAKFESTGSTIHKFTPEGARIDNPYYDGRSQRVRFETNGSTQVDPENPSPNTLIQKPFGFKYNPVTSRTTDVERFTKFLGTSSGGRFQANYAILQQSQQELNQKVASANRQGGSFVGNLLRRTGARILGTFLGNVGFTANLAKQIAVNGTGTHFINNTSGRFYIDNIGGGGGVAKQLFKSFLKNTFNLNSTGFKGELGFDPEGSGKVESNLKDRSSFLRFDKNNLNNYFSGDNSGNTGDFAKLASKARDFINGIKNPVGTLKSRLNASLGKVSNPLSALGKDNSGNTLNFDLLGTEKLGFYEDLYNAVQGARDKKAPVGALVDLNIVGRTGNTRFNSIVSPDGKAYTVKNTLAGKFGKDASKAGDTIARADVIDSTTIDTTLEDQTDIQELYGAQFIPFSFSSITPDKSSILFFNAFLDSYSDSFQGTWNGTQYIGRAEQFYTYQGFGRDINFAFKAAAFNRNDLRPLYRKLNLLAGTTAPSYSKEGNFMRGTLTRITIGDLLYRQNGYISGVDLSWNTTYPWEKDFETLDGPNRRVPHLLDVSVKFTPIHDFNVKSDLDFNEGETYFGRNLEKDTATTVNELGPPSGIQLPNTLPVASGFQPRGFVEVGEGNFGGVFNQGDYVNIDDLPESAFEIGD